MVQWLRIHVCVCVCVCERGGGAGSIPSQGAKNPCGFWPKNQNTEHKQSCNEFTKDFLRWSTSKKIFKKN